MNKETLDFLIMFAELEYELEAEQNIQYASIIESCIADDYLKIYYSEDGEWIALTDKGMELILIPRAIPKTYDNCGDYGNKSWMKIRMQVRSIAQRAGRIAEDRSWLIHRWNEINEMLVQKIFYEGKSDAQ